MREKIEFEGESRWELEQKVRAWLLEKNNAVSVHFVRKDEGAEGLFKLAIQLLRNDYHETIQSTATGLVENLLDDDITDRDDFDTHIHETIDGSSTVTWSIQSMACLMCSDNDGVGVEEGMIDSSAFKDGMPWPQLAFCAFKADVEKVLYDMSIGKYDADNETEDPLEPACEFDTEEVEREDDDAEEEERTVATFGWDGHTYEGRGADRGEALLDVRKKYREARQLRYKEREEARRAASQPVPSE